MLDLNDIAIDAEAAENGKEFDFYDTGAKFTIARFNNDKAEAMRSMLTLELWDDLTSKEPEVAAAADKKLKIEVLASCVLLGWSGIGENGKETPYTPENALAILSDPRYSDVRRFVERNAMSPTNFKEAKESAATESVKNTAAS